MIGSSGKPRLVCIVNRPVISRQFNHCCRQALRTTPPNSRVARESALYTLITTDYTSSH